MDDMLLVPPDERKYIRPRLLDNSQVVNAFNQMVSPTTDETTKQITLSLLMEQYGSGVVLPAWTWFLEERAERGMTTADQFFHKVRDTHEEADVIAAVEWVEKVFESVMVTEVTFPGEPDTPDRPIVQMKKLEGIRDGDTPAILYHHGLNEKGTMWETQWHEPWKVALFFIDTILRTDLNVGQKIDQIILEGQKDQKPISDALVRWKKEGVFYAISNHKVLRVGV